jgi:hypothetical protein
MMLKRLFHCLLVAVAALSFSLPGQSAMVGTAQLQSDAALFQAGSLDGQRDWIREQLVIGGVGEVAAAERVSAMTDAQVSEIYQRVGDVPAGADAGGVILVAIIVLLVLEVTGYTDFIKD